MLLIKSFTVSFFIFPCKLLSFSGTLHLYYLSFFSEGRVQSKFPESRQFVYVGLRLSIIVNVSKNHPVAARLDKISNITSQQGYSTNILY